MRRHVLLALFSLPAMCGASSSPMQEGLWEVTTQTEIAGVATASPPTATRHCLSRQDVETSDAVAPKDDKCEVKDYRLEGAKATWSIECRGKERIIGTGSVFFNGRTAYSGSANLTMQVPGASEMRITHRYDARRIGDCSK